VSTGKRAKAERDRFWSGGIENDMVRRLARPGAP
jgi:hypothetical protein